MAGDDLTKFRPRGATKAKAGDGLYVLLQQLIVCASDGKDSLPGRTCDEQADGLEVVLDAEVDGARYVLLRAQPGQAHPALEADYAGNGNAGKKADALALLLSPREQEIVRMVAKGYPNKMIAEVLDISAWTVCTHIRRIFAKLGVSTRASMVARISGMGEID
jgi:DNA-binding NarL/FixJ family response regulator